MGLKVYQLQSVSVFVHPITAFSLHGKSRLTARDFFPVPHGDYGANTNKNDSQKHRGAPH